MAIIRHTQYGHSTTGHRVPHLEQLALHATILTLAVAAVLATVLG